MFSLVYDTVLSGKWVSTIRFYVAVEVTVFLRNDGTHQLGYTFP
jgi:hypothetical protein